MSNVARAVSFFTTHENSAVELNLIGNVLDDYAD